jgi:hypothetical protein
MGIFGGNKNKNKLILVFNIGSSSVDGALFEAQSSGIPKIIFSVREPIKIEEKVEINRFLMSALRSLEVVAHRLFQAGLGAPSQIFCVLSSPWYVFQTRIISFKKNTPFVFNEKLADELVRKEIKLFEEEHVLKYSRLDNRVRVMELKNIKTLLNGYEISESLNQKAKELEMHIFISTSGEPVLKKIEDIVGKYFHPKQIKFSSFILSFFTVARDLYPQQENFLLVDIGGEMTDISMIKKNTLRESVSFPLGRNFLARGVSTDLGCTLSEASSLISLFENGHAEAAVAKKLTLILNKSRAEWLKRFQSSLANLSKDISIPSTIYIAIDKDLECLFSETIKTEQFSQYTLTESKFEIIFLNTELLHNIALFKESTVGEPFIVFDSIYINRFLTNPAMAEQI